MGANRFDLRGFLNRVNIVAGIIPAQELFGVFSRSWQVPRDWAALATRREGDHRLYAGGTTLSSHDAVDVLLARCTPIELCFQEQRLVSQDRYPCSAEAKLRVRLIPDGGDLISFRRALLGTYRIATLDSLERYLVAHVRQVLARFASTQDVEALLDPHGENGPAAELNDALAAPCFAAGLVLEDPPLVRFDSSTYRQAQVTVEQSVRRQREHEAKRQLEQALEAAQVAHLEHLQSLLTGLKRTAESCPGVKLGELLRSFSETERGELYKALFAATPAGKSTRWIVVAAGGELLYYDPASPHEPAERVPLPDTVGSLRSVRLGRTADGEALLLAGAAQGVHGVAIGKNRRMTTYTLPETTTLRGGFNSTTLVGDHLYAAHSEIGLIRWDFHRPGFGEIMLRRLTGVARTVRHVQHHDGEIYFAADHRVIRAPLDRLEDGAATLYDGSEDTVTALWTDGRRIVAGNAQGHILLWEVDQPESPQRLHRGHQRAAESIAVIETAGMERMFFTDTTASIHARVLGDSFTCRYEAGGQTIRRANVSPDLIVGTNELRDRLILWWPAQPDQPFGVIPVARMCGHSIQDVCLISNA